MNPSSLQYDPHENAIPLIVMIVEYLTVMKSLIISEAYYSGSSQITLASVQWLMQIIDLFSSNARGKYCSLPFFPSRQIVGWEGA